MPLPQYGDPEGLADRLLEWGERLGKDKSLPWMGLGLISDLKAAAIAINADPRRTSAPAKSMEFDL